MHTLLRMLDDSIQGQEEQFAGCLWVFQLQPSEMLKYWKWQFSSLVHNKKKFLQLQRQQKVTLLLHVLNYTTEEVTGYSLNH